MIARICSATLLGVDAICVEVEARLIRALKRFAIVGLPDGVLREAKDRVRCAIEQSGFEFPDGEVIVSLAPAALPKCGSGFDLAIALSILAAADLVDAQQLRKYLVLGELSLDGQIKPVAGALAAAALARERGDLRLFTAIENAHEACCIRGIEVVAVRSLPEAIAVLNGHYPPRRLSGTGICTQHPSAEGLTFADVIGQHAAKRAMEIAAAGAHNLLLVGPPGSGKSMLARRMKSIFPPLSVQELLEIRQVHSAAQARSGVAEPGKDSLFERPFRTPHHTTSAAGLIGGGSNPAPGEISLAHRGILFLDEFTEIRRDVLESLREPLENRNVVITRAKMRVRYPADFILLAAMNPCPCGRRGMSVSLHSGSGAATQDAAAAAPAIKCECMPASLKRYASRLSGPIVDRIDLQIWVPPVPIRELGAGHIDDPTQGMQERVCQARILQQARFPRDGALNATMTPKEVRTFCKPGAAGLKLLERAAMRYQFSARGYTRVLKVARTIADLEGVKDITAEHIGEALSYRIQLL